MSANSSQKVYNTSLFKKYAVIYGYSQLTATNVFQQYIADEKVKIPFHPGKVCLEMDIHVIEENQKASVKVLRPFENMNTVSVVGEYLV